jgi:hypothetical protein
MSIDKKGFRYRLSNVLAWVGSLVGGYCIVMLVNFYDDIRRWEEPIFMGLAVYLGCALINYLMVGSLRLLPWKDIE